MDWTSETINTLIAHRDAGLTSGEIARIMGITRNAVMGKLNRLGLVGTAPKYDASKPRKPRKPRPPKPKPEAVVVVAEPEVILPPEPVEIEAVEPEPVAAPIDMQVMNAHPRTILSIRNGECKWPLGPTMSKPEFFCGEPCQGVYCKEHSKKGFQPARPRQYPERRV